MYAYNHMHDLNYNCSDSKYHNMLYLCNGNGVINVCICFILLFNTKSDNIPVYGLTLMYIGMSCAGCIHTD